MKDITPGIHKGCVPFWQIEEMASWQRRNFGPPRGAASARPELGVTGGLAEETGEVCRAAVKLGQGIRGTEASWIAELQKECGDVFVKLVDVADYYGFDLAEAIAERWRTVGARDYRANPLQHGIEKESE